MPKIDISAIAERVGTGYPAPYDVPCRERALRRLGDAAGLTQFGVNLVRLPPGTWSSQRHWHALEDELIYVLDGELTLVTDGSEQLLRSGDCAGFKAGVRDGHHLQNRSPRDASFLVVGTRNQEDWGEYSDIDMTFSDKGYRYKDGKPY